MSKFFARRSLQYLLGIGLLTIAVGGVFHVALSSHRQGRVIASPELTPSPAQWQRGSQGWANVAIGGGGYVTGVYLHPRQKDLVYIKTDVGGIYRWNPSEQSWVPLTDRFPRSQANYYGGEAVALDPNAPNVIYFAGGKYLWNQGAIFKSTDYGKTWKKMGLELPMGGNQGKRWVGERLAVNPLDSKVLLFGSRQDGLWRSSDAGETWSRVKTWSAKTEDEIGIPAIVFDPQQSGVVYASAYGDGIYRSTDAGMTWQKLPGSPQEGNRMVVANRTLYVTASSSPQVSRYANNTWKDITPDRRREAYNGITVDPNNPQHILVATGETIKTRLYQSLDGGNTWKEKGRQLNSTTPWKSKFDLQHPWIAGLEFDPHTPGRVWLTDWYSAWRTEQIQSQTVPWTNYANGHEEVVTMALAAPPRGALLVSGVLDVEGFQHNNGLDQFPSRQLGLEGVDRGFQGTNDIAYAFQNPLHLVRLGGRANSNLKPGATSSDGGRTWRQFADFPKDTRPTRVAMSATNPKRMVVTVRKQESIQTQDGGKTWNVVKGMPFREREGRFVAHSLAADTVDGNVFYFYDDRELYRSDDGGISFKEVGDGLPHDDWHVLEAAPGIKGELWLAMDDEGLFHSRDGGENFTQINGVQDAFLVALGKSPEGSQVPALYLYGKIDNQGEGIFRSLDRGKTWLKITDSTNPIGNEPLVMEASQQIFGLVFVSTNGRGIFYRYTGQL